MNRPISMFGPDFPFGYDEFLNHGAGLGSLSGAAHGTEVSIWSACAPSRFPIP